MGKVNVVLGGPRANRETTEVELVGTSNKSECTRASEMPGACLAVLHTAGASDETDSTMRRCVPQPSAIVPARYHVSYCAWPAEARFGGYAKHGECTRRRKPGLLANCPGDSAADRAALGATECHRARVEPGLNRDSRSGQFDRQGNAVTIANQVALTAMLSPICRIWPSQQPPKTARTEQLSTTARDQSIWPPRESQSSPGPTLP